MSRLLTSGGLSTFSTFSTITLSWTSRALVDATRSPAISQVLPPRYVRRLGRGWGGGHRHPSAAKSYDPAGDQQPPGRGQLPEPSHRIPYHRSRIQDPRIPHIPRLSVHSSHKLGILVSTPFSVILKGTICRVHIFCKMRVPFDTIPRTFFLKLSPMPSHLINLCSDCLILLCGTTL